MVKPLLCDIFIWLDILKSIRDYLGVIWALRAYSLELLRDQIANANFNAAKSFPMDRVSNNYLVICYYLF